RLMTDADWDSGALNIGMFLNGTAIPTVGPRGEPVVDDSFLVVLNAHHEPIEWTLPARRWGPAWAVELDTAHHATGPLSAEALERLPPGSTLTVTERSLVVLRRLAKGAGRAA